MQMYEIFFESQYVFRKFVQLISEKTNSGLCVVFQGTIL